MIKYLTNIIILFSLLLFPSCDTSKGLNVLYLFDVSGSFHREALPESILVSEKILELISDPSNGINEYPQTHQVSTIETQSIMIGSSEYIHIDKKNLFDIHQQVPEVDHSSLFSAIKNSERSSYTDISGALLTASNSMQGNYKGKCLIVFSDFVEELKSEKDYIYSLDDIIVFGVHAFSQNQIQQGNANQDIERFINMLLSAGCKRENIQIGSLSSIVNSPQQIISFFKERIY